MLIALIIVSCALLLTLALLGFALHGIVTMAVTPAQGGERPKPARLPFHLPKRAVVDRGEIEREQDHKARLVEASLEFPEMFAE